MAIRYGQFITVCIDFLIVALALFFLVKQINRMKREEAPTPSTIKNCPYCISVIDVKASRCPSCTAEIPVSEAKSGNEHP